MSIDLTSEHGLVRHIASNARALASLARFMLDTVFDHPEYPFSQGVYVASNVLRRDLGLDPKGKPGDIDLLLIPGGGSGPDASRTMAIEVKVVRPTITNPSRNSNSYGRSQVAGLLRDGFPFVGLLHIVIPEKLPPNMLTDIPFMSSSLGPDGEPVMTGETMKVDMFPIAASKRQHSRLLSLGVPSSVAFTSVGIGLSEDGRGINSFTLGDIHPGRRNPAISSNLLGEIERHVVNNSGSVYSQHWSS
jgi:hypothetical protein